MAILLPWSKPLDFKDGLQVELLDIFDNVNPTDTICLFSDDIFPDGELMKLSNQASCRYYDTVKMSQTLAVAVQEDGVCQFIEIATPLRLNGHICAIAGDMPRLQKSAGFLEIEEPLR